MNELETIYGFMNEDNDWVKRVVVIGAGGFGRECGEVCKRQELHDRNIKFIGYLDEDTSLRGKEFNGDPVLGGLEGNIFKNDLYFVVGIGDPTLRKELTIKAMKIGYKPITIIDPTANIMTGVKIGVGVVILPNCQLAINSTIGNHTHLNYSVIVGHDAIIEEYVTLSPASNIMGNCTIKKNAYLGLNCSILQGLTIGENSVIGASAVVLKDIEPYTVNVGIPSKVVKRLEK